MAPDECNGVTDRASTMIVNAEVHHRYHVRQEAASDVGDDEKEEDDHHHHHHYGNDRDGCERC